MRDLERNRGMIADDFRCLRAALAIEAMNGGRNRKLVTTRLNGKPQMQSRFAVIAIIIVYAATVNAQSVTKCVDSTGKVSYSDTECVGQRSKLSVSPNEVGDGGARAAKQTLQGELKANAVDLVRRRYRETSDRTDQLRAALDGNESEKKRRNSSNPARKGALPTCW